MTEENRSLKDRMFVYESETKYQFTSDQIVVARIDGRGFSKFTKGFDKPFDAHFTDAMISVTKFLVEETGATIGYTQSDEISLIWHTDNPNGQIFFNGKIQKLASVCASIATAKFNQFYDDKLAFFDCRVFSVPSKEEAVNYLIYRQQDATRNSVSMAAHKEFGHKKLMNKTVTEQKQMLLSAGIDWDNYQAANKIGTYVQREKYTMIPYEHDARVPVKPEPCIRTRVANLHIIEQLPFTELFNVVFGEKDVIK